MGTQRFMGTEFQPGKIKSSADGWRGCLHNSVNVLNATELST